MGPPSVYMSHEYVSLQKRRMYDRYTGQSRNRYRCHQYNESFVYHDMPDEVPAPFSTGLPNDGPLDGYPNDRNYNRARARRAGNHYGSYATRDQNFQNGTNGTGTEVPCGHCNGCAAATARAAKTRALSHNEKLLRTVFVKNVYGCVTKKEIKEKFSVFGEV
jgi:hypothetical protein